MYSLNKIYIFNSNTTNIIEKYKWRQGRTERKIQEIIIEELRICHI